MFSLRFRLRNNRGNISVRQLSSHTRNTTNMIVSLLNDAVFAKYLQHLAELLIDDHI